MPNTSLCIYTIERKIFLTMNQYKEVVVSMNLNHVEKEVQEPRHISVLEKEIFSVPFENSAKNQQTSKLIANANIISPEKFFLPKVLSFQGKKYGIFNNKYFIT